MATFDVVTWWRDRLDLKYHVEVEWWRSQAERVSGIEPEVEWFVLDIPDTSSVIVTDGGQYQRADGTWIFPWTEVNGEWVFIHDDPANPYVRVYSAVEPRALGLADIDKILTERGF